MWIETENQTAVDANEITAVQVEMQGHFYVINLVVRGHDRSIEYMHATHGGEGDPAIQEALDAAKAAVEAAKCHCRHQGGVMITYWGNPTEHQREILCDLIRSFGLGPERVALDGVRLVKVPLFPYIECTVFKRDENGKKYLTGANKVATTKRRYQLANFTREQHAILERVHAAFESNRSETP